MKKLLILCVALTCAIHVLAYDFYKDGIYYNKLGGDSVAVTCESRSYNSYSGSVTIPETVTFSNTTYRVTTIGSFAFRDCSDLTSVTIPNSVITIGSYAFLKCSGLTSVTIPNSVTTIGNYAFEYCSGLISVTIPNFVTTIGDWAFALCSGLTSVTIGNSVTTIGESAFYDCRGLTFVTIGNSVTTIGKMAFWECYVLTSITIPNSVTTIGPEAFAYCYGLTSVTIPNSVTTIGEWAFDACTGLTSVTIPNSVTEIGSGAFSVCSGLTSIDVDAANTHYCSVDGVLFNYAKNTLIQYPIGNTRIAYSIPSSVTTIESYAFYFCRGLTSITIPNSVTTIGSYAFSNCSKVTSITCYATIPPTCWENCFNGIKNTIPVYVPLQSFEAYKQTDGWKDFAEIQAGAWSGTCGEKLFWQYYEGTLFIEGSGGMYNYTSTTIPWKIYQDSIQQIIFPAEMTSIGDCAFRDMTKLTSITIPNAVISIGDNAFSGCNGLTSVVVPNDVTTIGDSAFANCIYLSDVVLGANVTNIGCNAFAGDYRLENITCYAPVTPNVCNTTFSGINKSVVYLYVPADYQRKYQVDPNWAGFNLHLIGAEEKPITGDEVVVTPSTDNATFTWPVNPSADGYSLEITKDGRVFCTLKFNAQGQLTGIAFAPGRGAAREMAAAEMTANGWQFTVTGLSQASKYGYTLDALNAGQQSIKHYEGEFYTDGYTGLDQLTDSPTPRFTKIIQNNRLLILRNDKMYNAIGGVMR